MKLPTTTFKDLREAQACTKSYRRLAKALGGLTKYGRTTPITCLQILDACGLDDLEWVFEEVDTLTGNSDTERRIGHLICAATGEVDGAGDRVWNAYWKTSDAAIETDEDLDQVVENVKNAEAKEMQKQTTKLRKYLVKHGG